MKVQKNYLISLFTLCITLLFVSACSQTATSSNSSTGNSSSGSLTAAQVLQKSATAMQQLKSANLSLQSTSNIQTASGSTPASATPTTGTPQGVNVSITGTGKASLANKEEQIQFTLNNAVKLSEIIQGSKVYIQNPQGKWYVLNKSSLQSAGGTFSGVNVNQSSLLNLVQHSQITDHGNQTLNGQTLRHITATLNKSDVQQLLQSNPQFGGNMSQQSVSTVLSKMKSLQATIDLWIGTTHYYVHQTEVKLDLMANVGSSISTPTTGSANSASISTKTDSTINLSNFNGPVTITPPSNATSISNPGAIFGTSTGGMPTATP